MSAADRCPLEDKFQNRRVSTADKCLPKPKEQNRQVFIIFVHVFVHERTGVYARAMSLLFSCVAADWGAGPHPGDVSSRGDHREGVRQIQTGQYPRAARNTRFPQKLQASSPLVGPHAVSSKLDQMLVPTSSCKRNQTATASLDLILRFQPLGSSSSKTSDQAVVSVCVVTKFHRSIGSTDARRVDWIFVPLCTTRRRLS